MWQMRRKENNMLIKLKLIKIIRNKMLWKYNNRIYNMNSNNNINNNNNNNNNNNRSLQ